MVQSVFPFLFLAYQFIARVEMVRSFPFGSQSLPDVVAGTIAHYLSKSDTHKKEDIMVKKGADKVLCFLAGDGIGLKKGTFVIRLNTDGMIERGTVEFSLVNPPTNVTIIPIFE